ncbi:MAG: CotH kinase family protein [Tepidisphaerales bacterium]
MRTLLALLILAPAAFAGKEESPQATQFWTADRVHTIHLRVSPQQWQMMQPIRVRQNRQLLVASAMPRPSTQPSAVPVLKATPPTTQPTTRPEGERLEPNFYGMEFAYVKAAFECDGVALKDVGFRQRGNSSYNWGVNSGFKRPFKVSFKHFVDGQKLHGLTGFYLNNNAYDPSFLRETIGYEAFRAMGVPAPRTTFALVYLTIDGRLDHEYLGLYTLIEELDSKAFLKEHFDSAKGLMLKPWSIHGLPYLGEQWDAYESYYNSRTEPTPKTARRTIDFIKLVNYADDETFRKEIADYLDVDEFLRWMTVEVVLSNLDTIFYTGHNFYLYLNHEDDRFAFLPWDLNLAFAGFTSAAPVEPSLHLSLIRPHTGEAKIIDRILAMPRYRELYLKHVREFLAGYFQGERICARIDAMQAVMARADAAADAAWRAKFVKPTTNPTTQPAVKIPPRPVPVWMGWQGQPAIPLKTFVTRRTEAVNAQLAGETDGYTPGGRRGVDLPAVPPGGLRAPAAFGSLSLFASAVMRSADRDYDRKLTRKEMHAAIEAFFAGADTGNRQWLDETRLTLAIARALPSADPQRRGGGGGGGGGGGLGGLFGGNRTAGTAAPWAGAIMRAVDTGRTGRVTLPQLLAAADVAFDRADRDKSGRLDESELLVLLDTLATTPMPPAVPSTLPAARPTTLPAPKPTTRPVP